MAMSGPELPRLVGQRARFGQRHVDPSDSEIHMGCDTDGFPSPIEMPFKPTLFPTRLREHQTAMTPAASSELRTAVREIGAGWQ